MATYIDNIVKFHTFSKSPVHGTLGLGDAVNPSGHTVTSSQVRTDDIPWFIDTFQGNKETALTWLAENADEARHNDIAYYGAKFKAGFDKPQCLIYVSKKEVEGKLVDLPAEECGWQDFSLKTATTLKNSEGKDVIAIHKNCAVEYVDGGNNASTNSNRWSMFVKTADGRILDHFVASTDKIHQGMPSSGYNALVLKSGAAIDEGELDNNYIGNTFAGIIHFNSQQTAGHDTNGTIKVTCYEYIGDKLDATLSNIDAKISQVVGDAFDGAVVSVTADTTTQGYGLTVSNDGDDTSYKVITVTPGSVDGDDNGKLVTGSAVKTYVDEVALGTDGAITDAISGAIEDATLADTTSDDTTSIEAAGADNEGKLVTVKQITEYVTDYVAENAKITVNSKEGVQDITIQSGSIEDKTEEDGTVTKGDLVQIKVENGTADPDGSISVNISAVVNTAAWDEEKQEITDENALLVAGVAQQVINQTIINQITEVVGPVEDGKTPTIGTAIEKAIADATLADGEKIATTTDTSKLVTVEDVTTYVSENAKVTLTSDTADGSTGITISPNATESTAFTIGIDQTVIATKKSVDDLSGIVSGLPATIKAAQDAADDAMEEAQKKVASVTGPETGLVTVTGDKDVTIEVSDTIATKEYASTAASTAVNGLKETAITGNQLSVAGAGVSVTLGGKVGAPTLTGSVTPATYTSATKTWTNETYLAKASDVATAISDAVSAAVGAIEIPEISFSGEASKVGFSLENNDNHYIHLATAAYTKAEYDETGKVTTEGSWTDASKNYLVTGNVVRDFVTDETAKAIEEAKAYSDSLHSTNLVYVVLGDSESLPEASAETVGKIYLVAKQNAPVADGSAISGDYVEYMTRQVSETEYTWEKIGTTAADLSGYAKSVTINGTKYEATAANAGALNLGTVVTGIFYNATASGTTIEGPNAQSVYATIATDGTLSIGVASATDSVMGVSKMFTGSIDATGTATDTAVSVKSASGLYTILAAAIGSKVDNVQAGEGDVLTGLSVSVGGTATAPTISVTNGVINSGSIPATAKVVANGLIDGTDVIETEKIAFTESDDVATIQAFVPADAQLTTWVGDMPNLESGYEMFGGCDTLETFIGDLSALTDGTSMFHGCTSLETFIGDLSSLTSGEDMFLDCKLSTETALEIVETLPSFLTGTHIITISVTNGPSALLAEITELAEAKGWEADLRIDGGTFS